MTIEYFPFDAGAGSVVREDQWAKMAKLWRGTGVVGGFLNAFEVYADSSGMQVKVKSGAAWIEGFYISSDAVEIKAVAASDPAQDRYDRVVLHVDWPGNTISILVTTGVLGAGVPLALVTTATDWEIALATVLVTAGVGTIAAGKVTDERTYAVVTIALGGTGAITAGAALTALGGAPIASPTFTGNATIRIAPRIGTVTTSATPTPNADTQDQYNVTALAEPCTFGAPTGTPVNGQKLIIRIKPDATPRVIGWNAIYDERGAVLPLITVANKYIYVGFVYNAAATTWDCLAVALEL